jgi:signal transduction histidine kinase
MRSLRRTLTIRLVVALTLCLLAAEGLLFVFLRREIVASFDEGLGETARLLASSVHAEQGGKLDLELGDAPVPGFGAVAPTGYFQIWNGAAPLYRSASLATRDLTRPSVARGHAGIFDAPLPDGRRGRYEMLAFAPTLEPGVPDPGLDLTLVIARERETLDARLRRVSRALGAVGLALLLLMPLAVAGGVRRGLSRLIALGRDVDAVDVGSLDRRLPVRDLPIELVPFAERINGLLDRLQQAVTRERRFSDDVAHQLRTPIAELRALSDVALAGLDGAGAKHRQSFEDARSIAIQMERLAVGLLAIARGESAPPATPTTFDLRASVGRFGPQLAKRASERGLSVSLNAAEGDALRIQADPALVESVLSGLFDNALEYTPPGGQIVVSASDDDESARLTVTNDDTTLTEEDLPHVFERFWRKNPARQDGAHSGLGLAVAQTMARAMGGGLRADRPSRDRFRVTLSLPSTPVSRASTPAPRRA